MRKFITILAAGLLLAGYSLRAQTFTTNIIVTVTNVVTVSPGVLHIGTDLLNFFTANTNAAFNSTNWVVAVGPNYCAKKWGASLEAYYPVNTYVRAGIGVDYIGKNFYEGSFNTTLGTSFKAFGKLDIYPYARVGVGYAGTGSDAQTGSAIAITGAGGEFALPLNLGKSAFLSLAGEVDHYSVLADPVYKGFLKINFSF